MNKQKIILLGAGSLAKAIAAVLTNLPCTGLDVFLFSRTFSEANSITAKANQQALSNGHKVDFIPKKMDWDSLPFLQEMIEEINPQLIIHTASHQSMWDLANENQWSALVQSIGYGASLPLQLILARRVAMACKNASASPLLINCCYPDAVNFVLQADGNPVLCGIGNIGIIEHSLRKQNLWKTGMLLLANHVHVQELFKPADLRTEFPRIVFNGDELDHTAQLLNEIHLKNEPGLNNVTAQTCFDLVDTLLNKKDRLLHLPGPTGLPGGYPVRFVNGKVEKIGTVLIDRKEEQEWQKSILYKEGILLENTGVYFSAMAKEKIAKYSKELSEGFSFGDTESFCSEFLLLKENLIQK